MWQGVVKLPLTIKVGRKKHPLNLNFYRNAHYYTLNQMKQLFSEQVQHQIDNIPKLKTCTLVYMVYPQSTRKFDIANVCSVADKFFSDLLVNAGKIPDDNSEVVTMVTYTKGQIAKPGYIKVFITGELL